ncbi:MULTISPECIES: alpha/beta hydrolase [unclassified Rhodosalinus]|uniref:alpha/beta hydrolase n=1 Tax=unclassified Rhodosalinus TaxID=2630183 RepID=UPI003526B8EB
MRSTFSNLVRLFGASLVLGVTVALFPTAAIPQTALDDRELPFLTLRNLTGKDDPGQFYGDERSGLTAGWCRVREVDLGGLAPLAEAAPSFIREELLRVDRIKGGDSAEVLDALEDKTRGTAPAVYVHGYYISFEKGCRRAILLQENAGLAGRFLWFSWPSDGSIAYYTHDEADLYWSVPDLADAIIEAERRFGGDVDVVGHSLGARGVVLALYEVANRMPDIRLDQIVLLAPDMDFEIFRRMLPRIRPIVEGITIYVAANDRPLALSAQLHGYPRLGETGNDVASLDGVEVVDLGNLPAGSPTGHLYHIYSAAVGADLRQLLNDGLRAADRSGLLQVGTNKWRLQQRGSPVQE